MQSARKKTVYLIVLTVLLYPLLLVASPADLSWYDISILELPPAGNSLHNNTIDISNATLTNINFSRILTGLNLVPPAGYENLRLRFSTLGASFRFVKKTGPANALPVTMRLVHGGSSINVFPMVEYPIVAGSFGSPATTTDLFMNITNPYNPAKANRGDYYFPLVVQIIAADDSVLVERTLQLTVHFRNTDTPVTPITSLILERYASADHIPVPYPYQPGLPTTTVAGINFQSNEEYNKYRLRVSPVGQTRFQFNHTNPNIGSTIPFRVTIPGRTVSAYEQAFNFNLDYKGSIGAWYDFLEIGIRNVNYDNISARAGDYTSTIRVDLISD